MFGMAVNDAAAFAGEPRSVDFARMDFLKPLT